METTRTAAPAPVIGHWRTSGSVHDEAGAVTAAIAGTDVYRWLPGGWWIAHDVDVRIGEDLMTTRWEREVAPGTWVLWMDVRFERES